MLVERGEVWKEERNRKTKWKVEREKRKECWWNEERSGKRRGVERKKKVEREKRKEC